MKSMTGFGQASVSNRLADIEVQVKTLNSRYLDVQSNLPRDILGIELELQREIASVLHRGHVDLWIEIRGRAGGLAQINQDQVHAYLEASRELSRLGLSGELDVRTVLTLPDVFSTRGDKQARLEALTEDVHECLRGALEQVLSHREAEGRALLEEITNRLANLSEAVRDIEGSAETIAEYQRQRLTERLGSMQDFPPVDESRLAQEVALFAERGDISEEIARLRSHIQRFQELLSKHEPIGRSLDFLCQELNREINTILAKAGRVEISQVAVEAKAEIERIREQVQNVE